MASPVVITRIQHRRGLQSQFDGLYPPGYDGIGGFYSRPGYNIDAYPDVLVSGELALCTDTCRVFLGNIDGKYTEIAATTGSGTGTITSVIVTGTADIEVSGSPITTSGVIDLALSDTTVIPGPYLLTNITVDSKGRITQASSGSGALVDSVYCMDFYSTSFFATNGNLLDQYDFDVITNTNTLFAQTIDVSAPLFQGIEFLQYGKYKVTINYVIHPTFVDWPTGASSYGFDLETFSTGITGNQLNSDAYILKSVNAVYNPGGEDGFAFLPGNGPSSIDVSTSNTFILDADAGSILWPAIYVKSFETSENVEFSARLTIERIYY